MDKRPAHTKWICQPCIWIPKDRCKIVYDRYRGVIGRILRQLGEYIWIEIIGANACRDHIHTLAKIPPNYSVSSIIPIGSSTRAVSKNWWTPFWVGSWTVAGRDSRVST
jgi:REP element-mobilizing transposase RayT